MTATLTTVTGAMKEVYEGTINDQLANERVFAKRIEASSEGVFETAGGKYVTFPVRKTRNHGISYRGEGGALAAAGRQGYDATQETLKYGYGRVKLTGQLIELARTNAQAFAPMMDKEMTGLKDDLLYDENRIFWGSNYETTIGATGIISKVTAGATSTTVTAPTGSSIEVGMVIDIVDNTGTPIASGTGLTVTSASPGASSFVVDASVTTTTSHYIVRTGNFNKEPHGILGIADSSGAMHNINPGTAGSEYWAGIEDSSTTTLTESALITNCDRVRRAGGKSISAIFCSLGVRRSYFNLMTSLRRYNEPKTFTGGLVGLAFNYGKEIPVVEDLSCPDNTLVGITESELKIYRTKRWYWADDDGDILKWVSGYDMWEALMKQYWQFVTHQRNAHFKMTNITEA